MSLSKRQNAKCDSSDSSWKKIHEKGFDTKLGKEFAI